MCQERSVYKKKFIIYFSSFFLPVMLLFLVFWDSQISPFGTNSLLHGRLENVFLPYFSYYKSILTSNNDIFYNFSKMGGLCGLESSAYYMFSPLNALLLLFPDRFLNVGITLLIVLKLGLCGLTCAYFLNKEYGKDSYMTIAFACCYALCGHNVSNISNVMFYDGFILFPLVMLGVSKILKNESSLLYFVSLLLTIITNGLVGYMSAFFSILIVVCYKLPLLYKEADVNVTILKIKRLVFEMIMAFGLTAWLWVPEICSLTDSQNFILHLQDAFWNSNLSFEVLFAKFFSSGGINVFSYDFLISPNLFIGVFAFAFVMLYFLNKAFSWREKLVAGGFLVLLYLIYNFSGTLSFLNLGIDTRDNFYKFTSAYTIEFFLICLAYKSFLKIESLTNKNIIVAGILYLIGAVLVYKKHFSFLDNFYVNVDIVLFLCVLYICYVIFENRESIKKIVPFFMVVSCINLFIGTNLTFGDLRCDTRIKDSTVYSDYLFDMSQAKKYLSKADKSFYRVESEENCYDESWFRPNNNNPLLLCVNGISQFDVFGDSVLEKFYSEFGFTLSTMYMNTFYEEEMAMTPISILGIKYIVSSSQLPYPFEKVKSFYGSKFFDDKTERLSVWKNNYAFPIGFVVNNHRSLHHEITDKFPLDFQNSMLKKLSGNDYGDVYKIHVLKDMPKYCLTDDFHPVKVSQNFHVTENLPLYLFIKDSHSYPNYFEKISVNGDVLDYHSLLKNVYFYLGNNLKNQNLNITFERENFEEWIPRYDKNDLTIALAYEDGSVLRKYYNEFTQKACKIKKITSSHLKLKAYAEDGNQILFMTIPYADEWEIKVNGKICDKEKIFSTFIGIELEDGDNDIEMIYKPKGSVFGIAMSVFILIFFIFDLIEEFRSRKKDKKDKNDTKDKKKSLSRDKKRFVISFSFAKIKCIFIIKHK